jgi:hypothetical protein
MKKFIVFLLLVIPAHIFGKGLLSDTLQAKVNEHLFVGLKYAHGIILQNSNFFRGYNSTSTPIDHSHSGTIILGWQSYGNRKWEQYYGYPAYGIGLYTATFPGENGNLGRPTAIYGFFRAPFKRFNKVSLNYTVGLGLTYNWKPYNPVTNPRNMVIGSKKTVYIELGTNVSIPLSKHVELVAGGVFNHFSNGALRKPNKGINLVAPFVQLNYQFNERPEFKWQTPGPISKTWETNFSLGYGAKQLPLDISGVQGVSRWNDKLFNAYNLSINWQRPVSHIVMAGFGNDLVYDQTFNTTLAFDEQNNPYKVHGNFWDGISLGFFGSAEFDLNRFAAWIHLGYYVIRKNDNEDAHKLYQVVGLKFFFVKNTFVGMGIRATQFSNADYIAWTIGHRIKWKRTEH